MGAGQMAVEVTREIAARRGYMAIKIRERGNVPRVMRKAFNEASKQTWYETGVYFHENLREDRFTPEHAREAGYTLRKGQGQIPPSKRTYYGRKYYSKFGGGIQRADPLVYTGETQRAVRSARVSSTSKRGRVTYAGANKLNYRHPKSTINMSAEFRRITDREIVILASEYDAGLDHNLKKLDT